MQRPILFYESVELVFNSDLTGSQNMFNDIPELRSDSEKDVVIRSARVWPFEIVPQAPSGNATMTMDLIRSSFLSLFIGRDERFQKVSLMNFCNGYAGNAVTDALFWTNEMFQIDDMKIDWTKSFVYNPAGFGTITTQFSLLFEFCYLSLPPGTWQAIQNNRMAEYAQGKLSRY